VTVKGKLLVDKGYWLIPWISASLGVGFNNARSFNSEPIIFEAVETPDFASHTQTSFTYTIGAAYKKRSINTGKSACVMNLPIGAKVN
jgi:hypothetical protein